jgi:hypothetical protein
MNFVDKKFEVQTLPAFRISQLGGVAEGAVTNLSTGTSMRLEGVMAVITRGGLDHSASDLDLASRRDNLVKGIRRIRPVALGQLAPNYMRCFFVVISRESCPEGVRKDAWS